jgi:hypothetical protein
MKTWIVLMTLMFAMACGGGGEKSAAPVAEQGTEVPTQTTGQTVQVPETAQPSPAAQTSP